MTHITQEQAVELARDSDLDWHAGYLLDDERDNRYHTLCNAAIDWYIAQQAAPAARKPLTDEQLKQMRFDARESNRVTLEHWWIVFARAIEAAHGIGTRE